MRRLFIIRKDLHLTPGKLGAMVAHCAEGYWIRLIERNIKVEDNKVTASFEIEKEIYDDYLCGRITKTICEAKNLNQLMKAHDMALEMGLVENEDFGMINDACLTELKPEWYDENGEGRCTVGIWFKPLSDEKAHSISKKYQLYKGQGMAETDILKILNDLNISFEKQEHKAIFSEEDSKDVIITLPGVDVKNLFVKDKNGNYGLVSMALHKRADLKKIAAKFGFGRLSFCNPDELKQYLNITPGSVTPLCIMFDTEKKVKILYDETFAGNRVIVHPLRNTASVSISFDDLCRFTEHFGHSFELADVYREEE